MKVTVRFIHSYGSVSTALTLQVQEPKIKHHIKMLCWWHCNPSTGEQRQEDHWDSVTSQASLDCELQASEGCYHEKTEWTIPTEDPRLSASLCPHTCTHVHAHTHHTQKNKINNLFCESCSKISFEFVTEMAACKIEISVLKHHNEEGQHPLVSWLLATNPAVHSSLN